MTPTERMDSVSTAKYWLMRRVEARFGDLVAEDEIRLAQDDPASDA
jgi:hypothetical protein